MVHNLQTQHGLRFSSPEQLFAEITFSLMNEEQLQGISNFNHRVQIIAKLLRQKRWCTPKGFYNHSEFGAVFRKEPPKGMFQRLTSTSQNKIELEKRQNSIHSELCTQNQLVFGEKRGLIEALDQVKTNPARWHLIKISTKGLLESFEKQWACSKELYQVNIELHPFKLSPEAHQMKIINQQIQALNHLSQQIEELAFVVFDKFCELTPIVDESIHVDTLFEFYTKLNTLTKQIAEEILNLNSQIDLEFAA